jgi:hypothetical protein
VILLLCLSIFISCQKTQEDIDREAIEQDNIYEEHECRFEMDDGQYLTLNHMKKKRAPDYMFKKTSETGLYTYYFNFCAPTIMTCNGEEDALAMQKIGDDCTAVLARGTYDYITYIDSDRPNKGVKLVYDGGDPCEYGNRRVEHVLKCDKNIDFEIEEVEETSTCVYTATWRTKSTCNFASTRQDMYSWEGQYTEESESVTVNRDQSLWDSGIIRFIFFLLLIFLAVNIYLFYQNIKRDPYRNYSRAIPFRDRYRQVYRFIQSKF